jgi:cytochrome c-type biogenesis protein CcmH/NrfF
VKQPIIGWHQDDEGDWVAELACGHGQHVRHNPPLRFRSWVLEPEGRARFLGYELNCVRCDDEQDAQGELAGRIDD